MVSGSVPSGGIAAFMKRAVTKANRALALGLAENDAVAQQPVQRGESAGDFLRALHDTKARIHVDLGPKIKARRLTHSCLMSCFCYCLAGCHVGAIFSGMLPK